MATAGGSVAPGAMHAAVVVAAAGLAVASALAYVLGPPRAAIAREPALALRGSRRTESAI
jgi:hypothetical protein